MKNRLIKGFKKFLKQFKGSKQEFDNLLKENQNEVSEFNIGSNRVVLEMNEGTTK